MVILYLLLALTTSYSLYAADTEKPGTLPLPNGLVTMASSDKDQKLDGCFFPNKHTAYASILSLAKPGNNSQENERKLAKMQELLKKNIHDNLQRMGPEHTETDVLLTTAANVNKALWRELSDTGVEKENLIGHRAQYQVTGWLYLLSKNYGFELYLSSTGQLPCDCGNSRHEVFNCRRRNWDFYFIKTTPQLTREERKDLLVSPLNSNLDTSENIAKAIVGYLREKHCKDATVSIVDHRKFPDCSPPPNPIDCILS